MRKPAREAKLSRSPTLKWANIAYRRHRRTPCSLASTLNYLWFNELRASPKGETKGSIVAVRKGGRQDRASPEAERQAHLLS
jgi:hypothetical protein